MMARENSGDWHATFPEDPEADPAKFFHRFTILAISAYCRGRKALPPISFKKRVVEGQVLYQLNRHHPNTEALYDSMVGLSKVFDSKKIRRVIFLICGKTVENPIESLIFNYSFEETEQDSLLNDTDTFIQLKQRTFAQLNHLSAISRALPTFKRQNFPLMFQLQYVLDEEAQENVQPGPNYERVNVPFNYHELLGLGARDRAVDLKLDRSGSMEVWYHSVLIQTISEIDDNIAEMEENPSIADDTVSNCTFDV